MDLQIIQNKIFEIHGYRVMADFHLAELYQVETRALKQAVKRNIERFPDDFMFPLSESESKLLIDDGVSQNVIPSGYNAGGATMLVFTEQGIAMLSSILRSKTAIQVNIAIMRAFVLMHQMAIGYEELRQRIEQLEINTNVQFSEIYQTLTELLSKKDDENKSRPIGYLSYCQESK
ncbi:MAG: ORF6N domain-containing protein [Prevotellaceae bacterium]|nr:ORF6N domain-containing protein [Prevotellaceae bacterium]